MTISDIQILWQQTLFDEYGLRKLRSDCDGLLLNTVKFKTLTTLGDRSFSVAAPQLWNSLPYAIRSSPSVASFKQSLKTFLFQKAFL